MIYKPLLVFGCSHSQWAPYLTWADILEMNGHNIINYGIAGNGNMQILMQLVKHIENYGIKGRHVFVQPSYKTRLFSYYINHVKYLPDRFHATFNPIKGAEVFEKFPMMDDIDFVNDWHHTLMMSIHTFLLHKNIDFNYIEIEQMSRERNPLLKFQQSYKIQDINLGYIENEPYPNIIKPRSNDNHMSVINHLEVAKKIVRQLALPKITEETINSVNLIHGYFSNTTDIDPSVVFYMKHGKNRKS